MRIAVFGMGYVGVVSAGCLARDGHEVVAVDPNGVKTGLVNEGKSPIVEPGLEGLIAQSVATKRLRAIADPEPAVAFADMILVCVGTPGHANGSLDLSYVRRTCEQLGAALSRTDAYKVVVMRSTMLPGSMERVVIPTLESGSSKRAGQDFGVCINPEFLREGTAISDYDHPPKTVIGATDDRAAQAVRDLYKHLDAPMHLTDLRTAEMVKYADNSWHALKVTFANEMGRLCKAMNVDSRALMNLFCEDRKLNVSTTYLRPGFAFGGSCLPKDVRAITYQGRLLDVNTPVLCAVLASNGVHIEHALDMILATGSRRIGLMGLSFKEGTDDMRESPTVTLTERLIGKGLDLRIFDRNVKLASLFGANRDYILNHVPHIGRLLVTEPEELFEHAEVIVVATGEKDFGAIAARLGAGKQVIDLVGIWKQHEKTLMNEAQRYAGIAW